MDKVAFIFPGQGSQYVGMGKELLEGYGKAEEIFQRAKEVTGIPLKTLCLEGPMNELTKTVNLQPALTTLEIACASFLKDHGIEPQAVSGHSLGEYPALWTSGALSISDCLFLVKERGRLMDEAAQKHPGSMAAVIGLDASKLQDMVDEVSEFGKRGILSLANHNSREQIVVTGEKDLVKELCKKVKETGKKAIMLRVSGAYHSPLMKDAARAFGEYLEKATFKKPYIPIYSNVTAKAEKEPDRIKGLMEKQIYSQVLWYDLVNNMFNDGIRIFIEVGPKKVLSNLVKKSIDSSKVRILNFESPSDLPAIDKELRS